MRRIFYKNLFLLIIFASIFLELPAQEIKMPEYLKKYDIIDLQRCKAKDKYGYYFNKRLYFGKNNFLLYAPFSMKILSSENCKYFFHQSNRRYSKESCYFLGDNGLTGKVESYNSVLTYKFSKRKIAGVYYNTKLYLEHKTIDDEKSGPKVFKATFELKYELSTNDEGTMEPVLKEIVFDGHNRNYPKQRYTKIMAYCPATGKKEKCVNNRDWYWFDTSSGLFLCSYIYEKKSDGLQLITASKYKRIGQDTKMIEYFENNKTTKFEYYDNKLADGKYYGKIKRIINPDLSEKRYTYFSDGIIKTVNTIKP